MNDSNFDRMIDIDEVCYWTGYSRAWIYELVKVGGEYEDKRFPKQLRPGSENSRQVKWSFLAIQEYIKGLVSASS